MSSDSSPSEPVPAALATVPPAAGLDAAGSRGRSPHVIVIAVLLLVSLAALSAVAVLSRARVTGAKAAASASQVSDAFQDAVHAVAVEQSFERAWRLGRQPETLQWQDRAAETVEQALTEVAGAGTAGDGRVVTQARSVHAEHRRAVQQSVASGGVTGTAVAESTSEDLQDLLSTASRRAHQTAVDRRLDTTTSATGLLGLLGAAGATAAAAAALALLHARRTSSRLALWRERADRLAFADALTGVPNRDVLRDRLERALFASDRSASRTGLVVIDLDHFKEINDALGHDYGDQLLIQIAARLSGPLRISDTVARLGGDEFAVLLPVVQDLDTALLVAEKLQAVLVEPFCIYGLELSVEASMGVVVFPDHGRDAGTLLQRADVAMYVAKDAGLSISAYEPRLDGSSPARASLLGDLRRAIDHDELVLAFQPKRSVATGAVEGVEALVRWQHPVHGLVPPDEFVPLAERTGLVHPLTTQVLAAALAESRHWLDAGVELPVAVNLSARSLFDRGFAAQVEQMLAFWQVPGHLLELEVTETALLTDPERARSLVDRLAGSGVVLAIDDFGTGYSSLTTLRTLPVHDLKIDRSFVTDMLTEPNDAFIVRSVISLAHDVGLRVVAEGVESAETLAALRELGCDVAQGFHVGVPMTRDELREHLCGGTVRVVAPARRAHLESLSSRTTG